MKHKIISIMFCMILGCVMLLNLVMPDEAISYAERRPLAQKPNVTKDFVFSGHMDTLTESYLLDQFYGRNGYRSLKALTDFSLFHKLDNNNIYVTGEHIVKQEYPLNESSVINMAKKINRLYDLYLQNCNVVMAVIPDKNEFTAGATGHLSVGYDKLVRLLLDNLTMNITASEPNHDLNAKSAASAKSDNAITYLDLSQLLTLSDYYTTDLHWKQENLSKVVSAIGDIFDFSTAYDSDVPKSVLKSYAPFYGAYYGQAAMNVKPDTLSYVEDSYTASAFVKDFDQSKKDYASKVYDSSKLGTVDSYEVFFSGNSPLITIENPQNNSGKELIVFRDSFASSLAPLLLEGYSKITLVDLRFLAADHVGQFIEFTNQDVLILYGQSIINNSDMIK